MSFNYTTEFLQTGLSYKAFRKAISIFLSTPPEPNAEKIIPYLQKNDALMEIFDQTYTVSNDLMSAIETAPATTWVVITEGWCSDAAFNVPMMAALENAAPDKIKMLLFLRDSNLELIDANLTDGGRSIPKLIILNEDLKEIGQWGPRPADLQDQMKIWKAEGLVLTDLIPKVQQWYDHDGTRSIQDELAKLIRSIS